MDESKVIDLLYRINELFRKEWFKISVEKSSQEDEEQMVMDMFTEGNCASYAELIYNIFKDKGAVIGKCNDHILIKIGNRYYDAISGYFPNKEKLQEAVDKYGFIEYDLNTEEGLNRFEDYKYICKSNVYVTDLLNKIENLILEEKKIKNKI